MLRRPPYPVHRRLGLLLVASLLLHVGALAFVSRTVVFPALYESPALIAATLQPPETLPIARDTGQLEGDMERALSTVDLERIRELPPMSMPSRVALPAPVRPDLTPGGLAALAEHHGPARAFSHALDALSDPSIGRRGAFEGRMVFFDRLDAVRSDGEWLQGRGRVEAEDRVYTYTCLFPGRAASRRETEESKVVAVDYRAVVPWPEALAGDYRFRLTCDDGAIFQIDGEDVIEHDGSQGFKPKEGSFRIRPGPRVLRLVYKQGRKAKLGLILHYRRVDSPGWEVLDLRRLLLAGAPRADNPVRADAPDLEGVP